MYPLIETLLIVIFFELLKYTFPVIDKFIISISFTFSLKDNFLYKLIKFNLEFLVEFPIIDILLNDLLIFTLSLKFISFFICNSKFSLSPEIIFKNSF